MDSLGGRMKINLLVLVVLFLVFQAIAESQEPDKKSETTTNALVRKGREIHAEIKKLDGHDWAGSYYAGSRNGLRIGMELFVTSPKHAWETLRVTRVEKTRSEALMTQIEEDEPGPEIGWRLSTQATWSAKSKK